tara:strand:- start:5262 stop:6464 length:1203 start_codon:yes stop_codon:yes gene_type:complete
MKTKVLAIGDLANNVATFKKFLKKSEIHLVNFDWSGNSTVMDEKDGIEFFQSNKIKDIVEYVNKIKKDYDICLAMSSTGILVSYLSDLNYIEYFVGHEIRSPPFIKNSSDPLSTKQPLYNFNFLERWFYKKAYENAIACVVPDEELFGFVKFRNDTIRISGSIEDTTIFNVNAKPVERKKEKFTFLSPARMGLQKGTDKIWEALKFCETDFEILQVKWFDERTEEERKLSDKWINDKPKQITFIPIMTRQELVRYFIMADGVIGQVSGLQGSIERQALLCKKPLVHYSDPKYKFYDNDIEIEKPFILKSNEPLEIAKAIDTIVNSKEIREKIAETGFDFVQKISNSSKIANEWDEIFENNAKKIKHIEKGTSGIRLEFLRRLYVLSNRLHVRKIKKSLKK